MQALLAEEPDGGNLLVRIRRGAREETPGPTRQKSLIHRAESVALESRVCLIEQCRAALEHCAVDGHGDHGADFGHDAHERRLPVGVFPDAGPFAGVAPRPDAARAGGPMSAERVDSNAGQIRALSQGVRIRYAAFDLEIGATN